MEKLICYLACCSLVLVIAAAVAADEKVDFSGAYYLWAISETDRDHDSDKDDDLDYLEQKLRVLVAYKANDKVSVHMRADYSDGVWGDDFSSWDDYPGWAEAKEDNEIEVDRAYVSLKHGIFSANIGQHWSGSANYILWDAQSTGATVKIKLPVDITLHYSKLDENDYLVDEKDFMIDTDDDGVADTSVDTRDQDFYAANIGYSSDAFSANLTFAMINDNTAADVSPWAVGLQVTKKLGPVGLNAEVDQFGGSQGELDVVGTQLYLDATVAQNNTLSYGLRLLYAAGSDDIANEVQYQHIAASVESFQPFGTEGPMWGWPYPQGYPLGFKEHFDPANASAGVLAFNPYIVFKATDNVTLRAKIAHLTVQEDDNTNLDNVLIGLVQLDWAMPWFPNTTLSAAYIYDQPDYNDNTADDTHNSVLGQLLVEF